MWYSLKHKFFSKTTYIKKTEEVLHKVLLMFKSVLLMFFSLKNKNKNR